MTRGCLVQVSAGSITPPSRPELTRRVRHWARRRMIHLVASDGHSPNERPSEIRAAYEQLVEWEGAAEADRICGLNGMAVLEGLPLQLPRRRPAKNWRRMRIQ